MSAPDASPAAAAARPRPELRLPSSGVAWWGLVLIASALTARLTMDSLQLGCTVALVVLTVGLYARNRTAGLVAVWALWLLAPLLRRLFFLIEPIETAEPLALAPFLVTAVVVALELRRVSLSRRSRRLLMAVGAGYAIGIPAGLVAPASAAFALFAYLTAAGCFVIGYRDGEARSLALRNVLLVLTPILALYAFRQYYLPLPEWDDVWLETADINSAGSLEEGRVRVWGTLNSPGTFAAILGLAAVAYVTLPRLTPARLVGALPIFGALALTYVRSAWFALVVAILAIAVVTRGAAARRVAAVGVVLAVLAPFALGGSTGAAVGERFGSLGALGQDESAQERSSTSLRLVPVALSLPLGRGVGQAGEATRLAGGGGFRYTDNGYLSLLFQVGPFGFLLVFAAIFTAVRSAWRAAWRGAEARDVLAVGLLSFLAVSMFAGDALFGVTGMVFWYTSGLAMRRDEAHERVLA